jgi:hypothetical protein
VLHLPQRRRLQASRPAAEREFLLLTVLFFGFKFFNNPLLFCGRLMRGATMQPIAAPAMNADGTPQPGVKAGPLGELGIVSARDIGKVCGFFWLVLVFLNQKCFCLIDPPSVTPR